MSNDTQPVEAPTGTENSANNLLDVVPETITYAITKDPASNPPGKIGFAVLKDGNTLQKLISEGKIELVQKVDVSCPVVHTLAGISQVVPDEEEAVSIFNKGIDQKVTTKLRSYFLEQDEAGNFLHAEETEFDASEFASEPMKRRAMSNTQKAVKVLKGISSADLQEALRQLGLIPQVQTL